MDGVPDLSRRTVLRGAGGTAAAGLGIVGAAGVTAGREGQGGSGVISEHTWEAHAGDRFHIVDKISETDFACNGNERTWACYRIEFEDQDSGETHNLYLNPNRRVDTTEGGPYPKDRGYEDQEGYQGWHVFTGNARTCNHYDGGMTVGGEERETALKVSFKPEDDGNGGGNNGNGGRNSGNGNGN